MGTRSAESWFQLSLKSSLYNELDTGETAAIKAVKLLLSELIADGIDASQANRAMVSLNREIAPGNTDEIDLHDWESVNVGLGFGKDLLGQAAVFEQVVLIAIRNASGGGLLEVLSSVPAAAVEWCPHLTQSAGNALKTGGILCLYQPAADALDVEDGVSHRLRVSAVDDFVYWDIFVLGRHDDEESSSSS